MPFVEESSAAYKEGAAKGYFVKSAPGQRAGFLLKAGFFRWWNSPPVRARACLYKGGGVPFSVRACVPVGGGVEASFLCVCGRVCVPLGLHARDSRVRPLVDQPAGGCVHFHMCLGFRARRWASLRTARVGAPVPACAHVCTVRACKRTHPRTHTHARTHTHTRARTHAHTGRRD